MGYGNPNGKPNKGNKQGGGGKPSKPKNKIMKFPIQLNGANALGKPYNPESAIYLLDDIRATKIFGMLSVPVQISRALIEKDKRGNVTVGYITDVDASEGTMDVSIYGNFVEQIDPIARKLIVQPRVVIKDNEVVTYLGFDFIFK